MSAVWYEQQQEIKNPTDVGNFVMGVLNDTVVPTLQKIKQTYTAPPPKQPKDLSNNPRCPRCNRPMVLRDGKFGELWSCTGWNSKESPCNHSMDNDNGMPVEKPAKKPVETSNFDCKKCGKKLIWRKDNKGGKHNKGYSFFGCSDFPKCKQKYDEVNGEPKYD
ncbi:topoisomerase DNA-binding C4 zinc finger domain-containing protein [Faucicola mancuniensis]|uniref:topoisomerase DNA-binding C4 zinc finger domain-containing protein n=1 Tax=Faucicola mancuniensis TaxID=1309795 RepID=UPI003977714E